jgi:hypothetical protein
VNKRGRKVKKPKKGKSMINASKERLLMIQDKANRQKLEEGKM